MTWTFPRASPGSTTARRPFPDDEPVRIVGTLERIAEGVVVRGTVHAPWQAACSRCLQPVEGEIDVHVDELFETAPLAGETYQLDDDALDLHPLVRDVLLLELPTRRCAGRTARGSVPSAAPTATPTACDCGSDESDPRWAALRSLEL